MKLFLDDIRIPTDVPHYMRLDAHLQALYQQKDWTVVRDFGEFKAFILHNPIPAYISFDHDLGADENADELSSGYDCTKWLVEYLLEHSHLPLPQILCHSQNPADKANILGYWASFIENYG